MVYHPEKRSALPDRRSAAEASDAEGGEKNHSAMVRTKACAGWTMPSPGVAIPSGGPLRRGLVAGELWQSPSTSSALPHWRWASG